MKTTLPAKASKHRWYKLNASFAPFHGTRVKFQKMSKLGKQDIWVFTDASGNTYAHTKAEYLIEDDE